MSGEEEGKSKGSSLSGPQAYGDCVNSWFDVEIRGNQVKDSVVSQNCRGFL
jgi:hypothetical protein